MRQQQQHEEMAVKELLKAGIFFREGKAMARIRSSFSGPARCVLDMSGALLLRADIETTSGKQLCAVEDAFAALHRVDGRRYCIYDAAGRPLIYGIPCYAPEEDPTGLGWPVYRLPRVDRAVICEGEGQAYCLLMKNSQNYLLEDADGNKLVQVLHRGLCGGWEIETVEAQRPIPAEQLCGLFIFCRYLEQENEFLVV